MQTALAVREELAPASRDETWMKILGRLRSEYGEGIYRSWFCRVNCEPRGESGITIVLPTRFMRDRVEKLYSKRICELWGEEDSSVVDIRYIARSVIGMAASRRTAPAVVFEPPGASNGMVPLRRGMTFDNFVRAPSNDMAFMACQRAVEAGGPVDGANPVYLCGLQGMGKSHLLHAAAQKVGRRFPEKKVLFLDIESFMTAFVASLKAKTTDGFKAWLRAADWLIFDDLQFLATRGERTREEFFSMLNALVGHGRQVLLASDTLPNDLNGVEARLRSRLGAGLVVKIMPAEADLRAEFLQSRSRGILPAEVLEFVARRVTRSMRELEGALNRLEHHVLLLGESVDVEKAGQVLADLLCDEGDVIDIRSIQEMVCEHYGISMEEMGEKTRERRVARPRQIAMLLTKRHTSLSLPEIGRCFRRDHTTVIHGCRAIEKLIEEDIVVAEDVERLNKMIESGRAAA